VYKYGCLRPNGEVQLGSIFNERTAKLQSEGRKRVLMVDGVAVATKDPDP
jgi:hypothetical protein